MPYINLNGINTYYEKTGSGTPLVFIHGGYGGPDSTLAPTPQHWVTRFSECYTVITYDRRSCGLSTYPNAYYGFTDLVDDLHLLIDKLDLNQPYLIGSSAGGPIAIQYALQYQNSISGLILVNTSARLWNHPDRELASKRISDRFIHLKEYGANLTYELIERQQNGPNPFVLSPMGSGPQAKGTESERVRRVLKIQMGLEKLDIRKHTTYVIGELRNQACYLNVDLRPALNKLKLPTLVIHGDADPQVPYFLGRELAQLIDLADFKTVEGAGHGLMSWKPTQDTILRFLDTFHDV